MQRVSEALPQAAVLLPLFLALWALGSLWVVDRLGNVVYDAGLARLVFKGSLVLVLLPLPFIDELLSRPHFEARCQALKRADLPAPQDSPGKLARLLGTGSPLTYSGRCPGAERLV